MSAFGGLIITNVGRALQAKAQLGAQLQFTRMGLGDGELGGSSIVDLTALKHEVKSLTLSRFELLTSGRARLGTVLSNQDIASGFYWRELGIFAEDPDLGEILYCYGNAGALAEYIPAGGGPDVIEKVITVIVLIGQASSVSAVLDQSLAWATQQDLAEQIAAANQYTDQQIGVVIQDLTTLQQTVAAHQADTVQDEGGVHGLEIEEGLWTPAIVGLTVAGNHTYTQQEGYYYKTGKKVYINGKVRILTKDIEMSGYVLIRGLPFVPSKFSGGTIAEIGNINLGTHQQFALYVSEFTTLHLFKISTNSGANNVIATDIADDSYVYFSAEYLTN